MSLLTYALAWCAYCGIVITVLGAFERDPLMARLMRDLYAEIPKPQEPKPLSPRDVTPAGWASAGEGVEL